MGTPLSREEPASEYGECDASSESFQEACIAGLMAGALLNRGLRPTMVSSIVPIKARKARQLYREIYGRGPTSGQHPQNVMHYLVNDHYSMLASMAATLYMRQRANQPSDGVDPGILIRVHDLLEPTIKTAPYYRNLASQHGELICMLYFVARDLYTRVAEMTRCRTCGATHIIHQQARHLYVDTNCPYCRVTRTLGLSENSEVTRLPPVAKRAVETRLRASA